MGFLKLDFFQKVFLSLLMQLLLLVNLYFCQQKISPCPSVFSYSTNDSEDTWEGSIKLHTNVPLHGITIDVLFDRRIQLFGVNKINYIACNYFTFN